MIQDHGPALDAGRGRSKPRRLLVVLSDSLSDIVRKGAVVARYYNPGNVFDEVHFLLLNDDRPPTDALKLLVGDAVPHVHNLLLPRLLFARSLGWQPWAMRELIGAATDVARIIDPQLIRAYCTSLNALIAARVGARLDVPVLTSVHNHPEYIVATDAKDWTRQKLHEWLAARALRETRHVIAIYEGQLPYLERLGTKPLLAYNVLSLDAMPVKESYDVGDRIRLLSVGRHMAGKDLTHLAHAVAAIPAIEWTIVGAGPLRGRLEHTAAALGMGERTRFEADWSNSDLCRRLREYDIFAAHNLYPGIPKAVMEPMLAGLPVVVNRKMHARDGELDDAAVQVQDTPEGYRRALSDLVADQALRKSVGMACRARALALWEPVAAERRHASLHAELAGVGGTAV